MCSYIKRIVYFHIYIIHIYMYIYYEDVNPNKGGLLRLVDGGKSILTEKLFMSSERLDEFQ